MKPKTYCEKWPVGCQFCDLLLCDGKKETAEKRCNPCKPTRPECGECEFAKPTTNADRIRQMSDEELAEFLCNWDDCITTEGLGYNTENVYGTWICTAPGGGDINGECQVCALAWLKQEGDDG